MRIAFKTKTLNYKEHIIRRWDFKPSELEKANEFYDHLEEKRNGEPLDIVLIRALEFIIGYYPDNPKLSVHRSAIH